MRGVILINRIEEIKSKGFDIPLSVGDNTQDVSPTLVGSHAFSKIRVGAQILEDATINNLGSFKKANKQFGTKSYILKAKT